MQIFKVIFSYIIKDGLAQGDRMLLQATEYKVSTYNYNNLVLPLSMNPLDYGEIFHSDSSKSVVRNGGNIFLFETSPDGLVNSVTISGAKDIKWKDTRISDTQFKREIGSTTHYIENGVIILSEKELNAKPFRPLKKEKKIIYDK